MNEERSEISVISGTFYDEETIKEYEKLFNLVDALLPFIVAGIIALGVLVWGIIDSLCWFTAIGELDFFAIIVWLLIGSPVVIGSYISTKISLSYYILHLAYLKTIINK